tara:strand:+ start:213 stop:1355 length:1143 start_codon:yes stop_codon:yes gene_type:complete
MALSQLGFERLDTATTKKIGTSKNIIVGGAMNVAQRGTSETGVAANGFSTVDRFAMYQSGTDAYPSTAQADVASGTTPYTSGFRKSFKITNGNQTSGGQAADQLYISHKIEAQDMATSGWNYTSASSYVTLSFWIKSSVAQNFYAYLKAPDGTAQNYPFETGTLTADTWTKITKTIPGNSNLQFDMNANMGLEFVIGLFFGTDHTGTITLNQWGAWSSTNRLPDYGTANDDWYETNGATFELTGVQLEVGSVATDFEHLSFHDDLRKCQRYFYQHLIGASKPVMNFVGFSSTGMYGAFQLPQEMRANPSIVQTTGTNYYSAYHQAGQVENFDGFNSIVWSGKRTIIVDAQTAQNLSIGTNQGLWAVSQNASAKLAFNAEM